MRRSPGGAKTRSTAPPQNGLAVIQLDYLKPLGDFGRLEAGLKSTISDFNRQFFDVLDPQTGALIDIDTITNRFRFTRASTPPTSCTAASSASSAYRRACAAS
jgi:hypothetical protein